MLSGGAQRHALPVYQKEETEILNISFSRGIKPTAFALAVRRPQEKKTCIKKYTPKYLTPTIIHNEHHYH